MSDPAGWEAWAPPLDPPTVGGLPYAVAADIAAATAWPEDPHRTAAEQWESYAAMLPPTPSVASVATGVQSVAYSPAGPSGGYGLAVARAQWHRSFGFGQLDSAPLVAATYQPGYEPLADMSWWIDP